MWLPIWRMEIKSQRQKAILIEENEMCLNWQHSKTNCGTASTGSMRDRDRQRKTVNSFGMHTMIFPFFRFILFIFLIQSLLFCRLFHSCNLFKVTQLLKPTTTTTMTMSCVFKFCFLALLPPLVPVLSEEIFIYLFLLHFFFIAPHTQVIRLNQWIMQ